VFVGLTASASSAEAFVTTVLNAMQLIGRETPFDQLAQVLEGREVLLLLDNFEHLTDLAPLVADLLERCPKLRVLVTSRSTLNLRLEQLYEVVGLPAPDELYPLEEQDSARFFEREVRRIVPQFSWGAHDLAWFSRLHAVVAGSPLGLRLAAGLMRLFSLLQLVTELEQGVDVLHSQVRDMPERHRSLEAVFDSSWQALSADQRAALSNLAILRGSFDLELARVVTQSSSEVLLGLLNQSMLSKRGERLYLHEAVRQYAARARSPEHSDPVHPRLLAWVEKRLPSAIDGAIGPQEQLHTRWVQLEYDHIRTALTWGLQHEVVRSAELITTFEPTARRLGHAPELEAWLEHCLERPEVQGVLRGHCLVAAGQSLHARGEFSSVARYANAALELATLHADRRLEAQARTLRGSGLFEQLEYEACISEWREALRLQQELGKPRAQGWLHWALTQVCVFAQRFAEAQTHADECMRLYQKLESRFGMMTALQVQALIHGQRHEYEQERAALLETLPLFEHEHAPLDEAYSHMLLGANAVHRQDFVAARASFTRNTRLSREAGYVHGLIYALADYAFLAHAERRFEHAALLLLACQNLLRQRNAKYEWHLSEEMLKPHVPPSVWAVLERQAHDLDLEEALALTEGQPRVSN
jgi:tetratricopeptide (TPR) repeat protein